ncbi:MAG TPA: hypothetical protein VIU93_10055 [Gallionellaceae bacterium]
MKTLAIALLLCLLAACSTTPDYDGKFGDAVREARLKMTINPDAGRNPDLAMGLDGKAAQNATVRYQATFKTPPPAINVTNIGGSMTTGGTSASGY